MQRVESSRRPVRQNGKPSGQTPFRAALPAGRYRVRLANDEAGHDEITTVTVEPGRTATIARVW